MGRYYNGDINGKFWFGVQSSTDASFFGGEEYEPNHMDYYFDTDDLDDIRKGIKTCLEELGDKKKELDDFFEKNNGYDDKMIIEQTTIKEEEIKPLLTWLARLALGEQILKQVEEHEKCSFEAEL